MAHAYNPSYLGGWDLEDNSVSQLTNKKLERLHLNHLKLGVVAHVCYTSYTGHINRRIVLPPGTYVSPYSRTTESRPEAGGSHL
jgi:hypothetical protein